MDSDTSSCVSEKSISGFEAASSQQPQAQPYSESDHNLLKSAMGKAKKSTDSADEDFAGSHEDAGKAEPLGNALTKYELQLYEYAAFSLSEEVDLFYCRKQQDDAMPFILEDGELRPRIQSLIDVLE